MVPLTTYLLACKSNYADLELIRDVNVSVVYLTNCCWTDAVFSHRNSYGEVRACHIDRDLIERY